MPGVPGRSARRLSRDRGLRSGRATRGALIGAPMGADRRLSDAEPGHDDGGAPLRDRADGGPTGRSRRRAGSTTGPESVRLSSSGRRAGVPACSCAGRGPAGDGRALAPGHRRTARAVRGTAEQAGLTCARQRAGRWSAPRCRPGRPGRPAAGASRLRAADGGDWARSGPLMFANPFDGLGHAPSRSVIEGKSYRMDSFVRRSRELPQPSEDPHHVYGE